MDPQPLFFRMLGVNVAMNCSAARLRALIQANWGMMAHPPSRVDITFTLTENDDSSFSITRPGHPAKCIHDTGHFLHELEGDVHVALQTCRPDLYFMHAGVAEVNGGARLLVARSGGGKSTTLWGMLHHGWKYVSDELAPIDLASMHVSPYPRALCLKREPPLPYGLPGKTIRTSRTIHIPVEQLPNLAKMATYPLAALYFVDYRPTATKPAIRQLSAAEAGARLYANALNQLAHTNAGLNAAVEIAKSVPSFSLESADLAATCKLVQSHDRDSRPVP